MSLQSYVLFKGNIIAKDASDKMILNSDGLNLVHFLLLLVVHFFLNMEQFVVLSKKADLDMTEDVFSATWSSNSSCVSWVFLLTLDVFKGHVKNSEVFFHLRRISLMD